MGETKQVTAQDGHTLDVYVARPANEPRGAVVVIQEIFGVNAHIRSVADRFAGAGYVAIAPALFDRVERGLELQYEGEDMQRAIGYMKQLDPETALLDVAAAFVGVRHEGHGVGVVGFCYGGFMAWLAATRAETIGIRPACSIAFYPGGIGSVATETPTCPVMLQFGGDDSHIGLEQIEAVRSANPEVTLYSYEGAQHGFNCDVRASYNPGASDLAMKRSMAFLSANIA